MQNLKFFQNWQQCFPHLSLESTIYFSIPFHSESIRLFRFIS
jgi:hypothetical protein